MPTYKEDLQINKWELADLWETHVDRYVDWGEKWAEAIQNRDQVKLECELKKAQAKDEVDKEKARLGIYFRKEFKKEGFEKQPTDKFVESLVESSEEFIDAKKKYYAIMKECGRDLARAEYQVNVLKVAKDGFDQRRSSMENLTKLLTGGFYSAKLPKALEPEIKEERERHLDERSREQSAENLRQRRERRRLND